MDMKKLAPWNWFKKEEEHRPAALPVHHTGQLRHYEPFAQFHQEIDRMFDNFFRGFGLPSSGFGTEFTSLPQAEWLKPTLDIAAGDKEYTICVELPGVDEKDVQLELSEDTLVIKGEKKQEKEEKEKNFYRMERSYGSFQRVLSLPEDAEHEGIGAAYKNGILTITIPRKAGPKKESRQISVKSG
ncbi:MAG: Hsp20/alpha crystallin family protein [Syntrophobacteraceae bacterium]